MNAKSKQENGSRVLGALLAAKAALLKGEDKMTAYQWTCALDKIVAAIRILKNERQEGLGGNK